MSDALDKAREALAARPSRSAAELQLPPVNMTVRPEAEAFVEGALFANNVLISLWQVLVFDMDEPPKMKPLIDMLVLAINGIGESAIIEAKARFPDWQPPTQAEVESGKRGKLGYD